MKKTLLSTFLFILFLLFISIFYLSFFGYETDKFNKIIKSEIKKSNNDLNLEFEKISILIDIKKLILYLKFINPNLNYYKTSIPLKSLRTNIDLDFLTNKKVSIKKIVLETELLYLKDIKPLIKKTNLNEEIIDNIINARFKINDLQLEFDDSFKLRDNYIANGYIDNATVKIGSNYKIKNFISNFNYKKKSLNLNNASWIIENKKISDISFFKGDLDLIQTIARSYDSNLKFKIKDASFLPKISALNYAFHKDNSLNVETEFSVNKNKSIFLKEIRVEDKNNKFIFKKINLDKNFNLINFNEVYVNTSIDGNRNNEFKIINKKNINIEGNIFDAKKLIKELSKNNKNDKFLKNISKDIKINFNKIIKGPDFPIKNFSLIGKIKKGEFEKILAKSDFAENKHLDIALKKQKKTENKTLEVYSDFALPLLTDYKFFQGLEGGSLNYVSNFNKNKSSNVLTIENFKLNKAPTLAKLLSLADLKGLTDTLKGEEGISFDTMVIKYESNKIQMDIKEIFLIGPSISILIDGYVEKKSGLISLRGTLVPAKTLNTVISKVPVVGKVLVGSKVGEGVFGISFKVKGKPDELKTTVNPIKTLTPRFITRALESAKKKIPKQQ